MQFKAFQNIFSKSVVTPLFVMILIAISAHAVLAKDCTTSDFPMDESHWDIAQDVRFLEFEGCSAMELKGSFMEPGTATLKGVTFQDGIIEFDMWIEYKNAMFTGLRLRYDEPNDSCEYVYFRPSSNHQYDAFQYYPHYKKEMTWQLYGQHQRALDLPIGNWFHFKIEVHGRTMACTYANQPYPFFFTDRLTSGSNSGLIQFISSSEVYIANMKVTSCEPLQLKAWDASLWDLDPRYISTWKVSSPVALKDDETHTTLEQFEASQDRLSIHAEDQGLINFTRYLDQPARNSAVLAEVVIESNDDQTKKLSFGYSDRMDLFLNGECIFQGDNSFRSENAKMRSRVHLGNDTVQLPLKTGKNILQAIVYERSGGWGMITQLSDLEGISCLAE